MKWVAKIIHPKPLKLEIKKETLRSLVNQPDNIEYSLRVFENDREVFDTYQDTFEIAKSVAFNKFGVPVDAWKEESEKGKDAPSGIL